MDCYKQDRRGFGALEVLYGDFKYGGEMKKRREDERQ